MDLMQCHLDTLKAIRGDGRERKLEDRACA